MSAATSTKNGLELFNQRVRSSSARTAVRWKEAGVWREATWADWDRTSREVAAGLKQLGISDGDRVAILGQSRPEWVYADVAILMAGAATVPIYQSNLASECEYILNDSGTKVLFVEDPLQLAKLVEEQPKLGKLAKIVYWDARSTLSKPDGRGRTTISVEDVVPEKLRDWVISWSALRELGRARLAEKSEELESGWAKIGPEHVFTIVYTSGTTGPPKGVVLTHRNITAEADALRQAIPIDDSDEQLLFLPLAHIFARILEWAAVLKGCRLAFAESIAKVRDNLVEVRPTFMCAVPRVLEKVYLGILGNRNAASPLRQRIFDWAFSVGKQASKRIQQQRPLPPLLRAQYALAHRLVFAKIHALLGGRMRFMVSGGAPLSKEIAEFFHAAGVLVLEGWGLTETVAGTCVNRPNRFEFGTVGLPVDGVEIKIASDGEILVRGGMVMKEYFGKPEATREAIDPDGWFHTGDIGEFTAAGHLKITDRKKDLIVNAGGKNIAPQNLENALKATPYISQVMVHGDKKPYLVALITLNEENVVRWAKEQGIAASAAELAARPEVVKLIDGYVRALNAKQPSYSSIKKFTVLPGDFTQESGELTPTLKVKRKFTYEKFREVVEGMYAAGGGHEAAG